jgi:hypothetical protein
MQPSDAAVFFYFFLALLAFGCIAGIAAFVPIIKRTWPKRRG